MERHKSIDNNDGNKWVFGSERRNKKTAAMLTPGPGTYDSGSKCFDYQRPRFFLGQKLSYSPMTPSTKVPHSWNYNPRLDSVKHTAPTITMKSRLSQDKVSSRENPGPGNYGISDTTRK